MNVLWFDGPTHQVKRIWRLQKHLRLSRRVSQPLPRGGHYHHSHHSFHPLLFGAQNPDAIAPASTMGRMGWRRSLHLLHRSVAPPRPLHAPPRSAASLAVRIISSFLPSFSIAVFRVLQHLHPPRVLETSQGVFLVVAQNGGKFLPSTHFVVSRRVCEVVCVGFLTGCEEAWGVLWSLWGFGIHLFEILPLCHISVSEAWRRVYGMRLGPAETSAGHCRSANCGPVKGWVILRMWFAQSFQI